FALLVYVSAWIKHHYPDVFAAALLNSQPMGFYAPAQIVRDAREHGVELRPVDVSFSDWDCTLEPIVGESPSPCPSPRSRGEGTHWQSAAVSLPLPACGERAGVRGAGLTDGRMELRLGLR